MHKSSRSVEAYFDIVEEEPVQGVYGTTACFLSKVVGHETYFYSPLVHGIEQCREDREGLVFLLRNRTPHAAVALFREMGTVAPAVKTEYSGTTEKVISQPSINYLGYLWLAADHKFTLDHKIPLGGYGWSLSEWEYML